MGDGRSIFVGHEHAVVPGDILRRQVGLALQGGAVNHCRRFGRGAFGRSEQVDAVDAKQSDLPSQFGRQWARPDDCKIARSYVVSHWHRHLWTVPIYASTRKLPRWTRSGVGSECPGG